MRTLLHDARSYTKVQPRWQAKTTEFAGAGSAPDARMATRPSDALPVAAPWNLRLGARAMDALWQVVQSIFIPLGIPWLIALVIAVAIFLRSE